MHTTESCSQERNSTILFQAIISSLCKERTKVTHLAVSLVEVGRTCLEGVTSEHDRQE
jgi:hypothetical protein